jgi:hypothetical protein
MKTAETNDISLAEPAEKKHDLAFVNFSSGNLVIIDKTSETLKILDKNQQLQLMILISEDGVSVNVNAQQINLNASEQLNLSAKKINIVSSEQIKIKSGGNFIQEITKDVLTEIGGTNKSVAKIQKMTASLGNIELKANDDVKLDGESVKLNSDE